MIEVSGDRGHSGFITMRYHLVGDIARLAVPAPATPERTPGLWDNTCFELFTRDEGDEAYREYNFCPSGRWAAYGFSGYRRDMQEIAIWAPRITTSMDARSLTVDVHFVSPRLGIQHVGASAVIEEVDGTKSYWALLHPSDRPDFHHPASLAYNLPPPAAP